jgi:hypothetical protein
MPKVKKTAKRKMKDRRAKESVKRRVIKSAAGKAKAKAKIKAKKRGRPAMAKSRTQIKASKIKKKTAKKLTKASKKARVGRPAKATAKRRVGRPAKKSTKLAKPQRRLSALKNTLKRRKVKKTKAAAQKKQAKTGNKLAKLVKRKYTRQTTPQATPTVYQPTQSQPIPQYDNEAVIKPFEYAANPEVFDEVHFEQEIPAEASVDSEEAIENIDVELYAEEVEIPEES